MRVAVVGAGLAGLSAADAVVAGGHEPVILEARGRVGGRVHSRQLGNGAVVEMGAEFILPGCTAVLEAAERFGLGLWDKGMRYGQREPRGVEIPAGAMKSAVAAIESALGTGEPMDGVSVRDLLGRLEIDGGAREAILARAEVSAAAPADLVPAAELALLARVSDLPAPGIAGGNQRLAEAFANSVGRAAIHLGDPVRAIADRPDRPGVVVGTDGGEIQADRCVVAVPASVINKIAFDPPLAPGVVDALASITYGHAAKLFVPFASSAAAAADVPPKATLAVRDRYWAWTSTGYGPEVQPVLNAFAGSAAALESLGIAAGPADWAAKVIGLREDLDLAGEAAVLSTWDDDPWVHAAYSVATPAPAQQALTTVHGRIAFAGEHLGGGMAALMEGAIRSGRTAVAGLGGSSYPSDC